jgi:uncharacterized protein (DUF1778 family)
VGGNFGLDSFVRRPGMCVIRRRQLEGVLNYAIQKCIYFCTTGVPAMAAHAVRKETPISMRFRNDDLAIIDRGADLLGLSRTEFMRRAALQEAQAAILNETVIRLSPDAYDEFVRAISAPPSALPSKAAERLRRKAPWNA